MSGERGPLQQVQDGIELAHQSLLILEDQLLKSIDDPDLFLPN